MYPSINIPAITGKIYIIIENLTDVIEELNKEPSANGLSAAQTFGLEGEESASLEGDGSGSERGEEARGATTAGEVLEKYRFVDIPGKGQRSPESKDSDLLRYLSSNEGLELIRLESTGQSLLRAQGFLEEKKAGLDRAGQKQTDRKVVGA